MKQLLKVSFWDAAGGEPICVVGIGARTPIGTNALATAAAVRSGISGLAIHPVFTDQAGEPLSLASDPSLNSAVPVEERMQQMLRSAGDEALEATAGLVWPDACVVALPEARSGLPAKLEAKLAAAQAKHLSLPADAVRTLARGHAGGLMALQAAAQWLSQSQFKAVLVIGVDSYHDRQSLRSLEIHHRLKRPDVRGGFPPGEGAGACLLVRQGLAEQVALPVLAQVRFAATAVEPNPLRGIAPCIGDGLTAAIAAATQKLTLPKEEISVSYCDLNGESFRTDEFVFAQLRTQQAFIDANDYVAPADCWGDVGAASGPLYVTLAAASAQRGYAKGRHPLLWAGSDSGYRSAVTLTLDAKS